MLASGYSYGLFGLAQASINPDKAERKWRLFMNEYSFIYQSRKPTVKPKTFSLVSSGKKFLIVQLKQ